MIRFARKIISDLLFPKECLICGKDGFLWCDDCQKVNVGIPENQCLICNQNLSEVGVCQKCKNNVSFDQAISCVKFKDGVIEKVIVHLKYNYVEELAEELANLLVKRLGKINLPENTVCIPVPLHKKRFLERGFNQSDLLANIISEKLGIKMFFNVLTRQKQTKQQAKLERKERFENLEDAFVCKQKNEIKNFTVLLIDDVLTTGATLNAAAKTLKNVGVKKVIVATVAHG